MVPGYQQCQRSTIVQGIVPILRASAHGVQLPARFARRWVRVAPQRPRSLNKRAAQSTVLEMSPSSIDSPLLLWLLLEASLRLLTRVAQATPRSTTRPTRCRWTVRPARSVCTAALKKEHLAVLESRADIRLPLPLPRSTWSRPVPHVVPSRLCA